MTGKRARGQAVAATPNVENLGDARTNGRLVNISTGRCNAKALRALKWRNSVDNPLAARVRMRLA